MKGGGLKTLYSDSVLGTFPLVTIFPAPLAVRGSPLPATYIDVTFPRLVLFHREKCPHLPVLPLAYTVYPSESVGDWVQDLLWILKPVMLEAHRGSCCLQFPHLWLQPAMRSVLFVAIVQLLSHV